MLKRFSLWVVGVVLVSLVASSASAHFVWLGSEKSGDETVGLLFFSEGPHEHDYHLPPPIAAAKLFARTADGKRHELETETRETDEYTGLTMKLPEGEEPVAIETECVYGVYGGALLTYYAQHVLPTADGKLPAYVKSKDLALEIVPEQKPGGISATLLWQGEPLAEEPVTLVDSTGEMTEEVTDEDGKVFFIVGKSGTIGLMANYTVKDQSGEAGGKSYTGKANYATLSLDFTASGSAAPVEKKAGTAAQGVSASKRPQRPPSSFGPPLPEAISSFGGAVADGWLYVYSGHTGREHQHSRDNLSQSFVRLNLAAPTEWEVLPMETPLQGVPLVAAEGKLYRIGGLSARNAKKEKEDLHSVDEFASFDPATNSWTPLPSLPVGRSSHDAAALEGKIYVVGGWNLSGASRTGEWQPDALVYDTNAGADGQWKTIAQPPFKRRALAVVAWNGRIWALGGMDEFAEIKRDVFSYDPVADAWTTAAELPGDDMQGFGISAWGLDSGLYVSGTDGVVYRLAEVDGSWEAADKLSTPRFFHRLLPGGEDSLLAIAGASMADGHISDIEPVDLK